MSNFDPSNESPPMRQLREDREKANAERDELAAKLATLERERAFDQAGIPTEGPGALFRKAYDGPVDAVDAIKAEAAKYGIASPADQARQDSINRSLQGNRQAMEAGAGGQLPPADNLMDELEAIRNAADEYPHRRLNGFTKEINQVKRLMNSNGFEVEEQKSTRTAPSITR